MNCHYAMTAKGSRTSGVRLIRVALLVLMISLPARGWGEVTSANLIPNPEFTETVSQTGLPRSWQRRGGSVPGVVPSQVFFCRVTGNDHRFLALKGSPDRGGQVYCELKGIRPHSDYLLEFLAYRPKFTNGVYLEVELFGQRHRVDQHCTYGRVQPIFLTVNSGNYRGTARLVFSNPFSEVLAFASPSLRRLEAPPGQPGSGTSGRLPGFFPVGIFSATLEGLPIIREAGFNAVQSYDHRPAVQRQLAAACGRLGLKYLPNFRRYQAELSRELGGLSQLLGFYIEDEPEIRSVPPERLEVLKERLQQDHPGVLTAVAMVRPQMVASYRQAADVFMIDPYPVPQMPLTWMSDSLDQAAGYVSRSRVWAIIQAFGGGKFAADGWTRRPTYPEMRCLTYLALVHGAHGLFYFDYPRVRGEPQAWEGLKKIVSQLKRLHTWLVLPPDPASFKLEMLSRFKADAGGKAAVHFSQKSRGGEHLLFLVNVIDRPVSFMLHGFPPETVVLTEFFSGQKTGVSDGNIREELGPYEVRVYHYRPGR